MARLSWYNESIESACTRILYFFNTIDTYFVVAGIGSFLAVYWNSAISFPALATLLLGIGTARLADFYPSFILFAAPVLLAVACFIPVDAHALLLMGAVSIAVFFAIQFCFMGIPDAIVSRDPRVPFLKMFNSLFTVAPTTVSFSMSVFFSFFLSLGMACAVSCRDAGDWIATGIGWVCLIVGALAARAMRPVNRFSKFHKPDTPKTPLFRRALLLNIDGVRKDVFDSLSLPNIGRLAAGGAQHAIGLRTVFRALTNPAFASIFTGAVPRIHGVKDNNFGQSIRVEGLPDIVPSIAYGSMHVKHFSKSCWNTRIVSLPRHSAYGCDDIMMGWIREDMRNRKDIRLFVADFSEADFLAHAYGSLSQQYKDALTRTDQRIGDLIKWMADNGQDADTCVIVCSDHGVAGIDHSYMIAESEIYVPFLMRGKGVRKGYEIRGTGSIMDICCTVAYLLGARYPAECRGQVFTEALEANDADSEKETFVTRFNEIKYDAEAAGNSAHVEISEGDAAWWQNSIRKHIGRGSDNLRILDIGCGDGFVGRQFLASGAAFKQFVGTDISQRMLAKAGKQFATDSRFAFVESPDGKFDVVTASSVFHHVVHPEKLARVIDALLVDGGILLGCHEPDKRAFQSRLFRAAAGLYKRVGGGIGVDDRLTQEFNKILRERYLSASPVGGEEILQIVEYHSPTEQYDEGVDADSGFVPAGFLGTCFPGYGILECESYTTFFCRPWLEKHRLTQGILATAFRMCFHGGNLFRYVLRKGAR